VAIWSRAGRVRLGRIACSISSVLGLDLKNSSCSSQGWGSRSLSMALSTTGTYLSVPLCPIPCLYMGTYPIPCLYVAPVDHMVGRVPLISLFLAGNSTPTIPHKFSKHKGSGFPVGCPDSTASDGKRGSNVYEVNTWLWNFGSGKPRLGGLIVEETAIRKETVRKDQAKRFAETRRRWRADRA
jgi:hypothetical protein